MICFERKFARASAWTFTIPPIKELIDKYVGNGTNWVDPFAGKNSPAQYTNDHNIDIPAKWHMDAKDFCEELCAGNLSYYDYLYPESQSGYCRFWPGPPFSGILFDPPYSYRQITEHYKSMGMKASALDTSYNFYGRVMEAIAPSIDVGGLAISFGWNSNGFGKKRGFEIIDGLIVAHGLHHNDSIVTVERKII